MKNLLTFLMLFLTTFMVASTPNTSTDHPIETPAKYVSVILLMDNGDDKQVVATVYTTLMAAEKIAKLADVEVVASDSVEDDIFVFSLKSEAQKDLTMKLFDEEGFTVAAHRTMEVTEGSNYRALNVQTMEEGNYIFEITDESGATYRKDLKIKR